MRNNLNYSKVRELLKKTNLSKRNREIIGFRYGLADGCYHSLLETCKKFSISGQRVTDIWLLFLFKIKGVENVLGSLEKISKVVEAKL